MIEGLIKRLRDYRYWKESEKRYVHPPIADEAADAIEELTAENERLKKANEIAARCFDNSNLDFCETQPEAVKAELEQVKQEREERSKGCAWCEEHAEEDDNV